MSAQTPLVHGGGSSHDEEALTFSTPTPSRPSKNRTRIGLCVLALILAGVGVIIWVIVRHTSSGDDPSNGAKRPFSLDTMYNRTISPKTAQIAWLGSENDGANGEVKDSFISVTNGSFYITTLPEFDVPTLLIDGAKLDKFGPEYTPTLTHARSSDSAVPPRGSSHQVQRITSNRHQARLMMSDRASGVLNQPFHVQTAGHDQDQDHPAKRTTLEAGADQAKFAYNGYTLSPDHARMLFTVNCTQLYRHSSFCVYLVYNIAADTMTPLAGGASLRLASWSPTSALIAYVLDNNIYVYSFADDSTVQVTTDGQWDHVINGVQDWAYEEEVFQATSALWWNPRGDSFAFLHFNETEVPVYEFSFYTKPYNQEFSYKYPKPGYPNSRVDLRTFNVTSRETVVYDDTIRALVAYEYVVNVNWFDGARLLVRYSNRFQNEWSLVRIDATGGGGAVKLLSQRQTATYFEPHNCLTSLAPLPYYIDLVNVDDYLQLVLFAIADGAQLQVLTRASERQHSVLGLNAVTISASSNTAEVYYTRETVQTRGSVAVPTLWSVTVAAAADQLSATAEPDSRPLVPYTTADPTRLTWQSASFGPSGRYLLVQESAIVPTSTLYTIHADRTTSVLTVLANNTALIDEVRATYELPRTSYMQIPSSIDGLMVTLQIMTPSGVNLDDGACSSRHPVLMYAYSGPGSQQATTVYPFTYGSTASFHSVLVSQYNYIIVVVDTIGTAGKGENYRQSHTYMKLGQREREDILRTANWIKQQCWTETDRLSYWGWSYGGFMTSFTAAAGSQLFNHLISVAPVTSWELYDSIYTERYMRTPVANRAGYDNSSVIQAASTQFDASAWKLFHGTADDNVHFQNSMLLVDALINLDVQVSTFAFPNRAHSLTQWKTGLPPKYLYKRLIRIFNETQEF